MAGVVSETMKRDGQIDPVAFVAAIRAGVPVGVCSCGDLLHGRIDETRRLRFYSLTCGGCGTEYTCPGGRIAEPPTPRPWEVRPVDPRKLADWAEMDRQRLGERDDEAA